MSAPPPQPPAAAPTRTRAQLRIAATEAQKAAEDAAKASVQASREAAAVPQAAAGAGGNPPDTAAFLAQLMQQQMQMARSAQAQQLAMQTQQASANADAALAAAEALAQQRRAGAGPAPLFHGARLGDDLAVNLWLSALELWFGVAHIDASLDAERIEVAAAAFRGPALQWWTATATADAAPVASAIGQWTAVVALLRKHYLPQEPSKWARTQLDALIHTGTNANVMDYTSRFRVLDSMLGKQDEEARVFAYERGLPDNYRAKSAVAKHATLDAATDAMLSHWNAKGVARALVHSSGSRHGGAAAKLSHTQAAGDSDEEEEEREQHGAGTTSATSSSSSLEKRLEAMQAQLSAIQAQSGRNYGNENGFSRGRGNGGRREQREGAAGRTERSRTPGVSDELAKQRLKARACIKCGEGGHYARDCTNELKTN
jgi:hypothetical protein